MPSITQRKKTTVVLLYLQGYSYQENSAKTGISKGSVVSILTDLRNGKFHPLENITDAIDTLREVAVQIRRTDLSLSQAALGLTAFQGIEALGVPPAEVKKVVEPTREICYKQDKHV